MPQGEKDGVVPPPQAHLFLEKIAKEASEGHIAWKFYPGEGNHWHLGSTIKDALEREYAWYDRNLI